MSHTQAATQRRPGDTRTIEEHDTTGPHREDAIEGTDDRGRRWYHLRPEPRRRTDFKVSIIPRGMALGVTLSSPDADRVSYSREELEAKIRVSLGGRVAEEVVYAKITTGAESDLQQLSQIARQMVGRWGMSEKLGPVTLLGSDGQGPLLPGAAESSPQTQWLIDEEVRRIVDDAHAEASQLLTEHREQLDNLAHALLEAETLDAPDAYAAAGIPMRTADVEASVSGF